MNTDTRWPRFAAATIARGVHSLLSIQLFVRDENLGALNLYAEYTDALTDESILVGTVLAQHASTAMVGAADRAQFGVALDSRDVIGQATGILMQREHLTGVQAFALLIKTSQRGNIKLVEIARWLVEQHESQLPT